MIPVYAQFPNQPEGLEYLGEAPDTELACRKQAPHVRHANVLEVAKLVGLDPQWVLHGFVCTSRGGAQAAHMPPDMPSRYWRLSTIQMPDRHGQRRRRRG